MSTPESGAQDAHASPTTAVSASDPLFPHPQVFSPPSILPDPSSNQATDLLALIDNSQDAIWSVDTQYRLIIVNAAFQRQFSWIYGVGHQPGQSALEGWSADQKEQWQKYYDQALKGDRFTVELRLQQGEVAIDCEVSFNPLTSATGCTTGVVVFARDISEQKCTEFALQEARNQLQAVLDAVPACVSWFSVDLKYLGINRYLASTFDLSPEMFVGKELGFMESSPDFSKFVQTFITSSLQESTVEICAQVDDTQHIYLVAAQKYSQGQAAIFVGLDITDRRRMEEALRESQERYALAMLGANDGLWDWNLRTNEIYFSARWKEILGYREDEIGNHPDEWFQRVHPEEVDWFKAQIQTHLENKTQHLEIEHRMLHRDGSYRWVLSRGLAVRDTSGTPYRIAGSQTDITKRKRAEEQLIHDALHDGLTGLPNRALFIDRLGQAIARFKRQPDSHFAVLFLDMDRFKVVNDSLGHTVGDLLLMAVAQRLEACIRAGDTVARLGGDEFTVLLENLRSLETACHLAERIHLAFQKPFEIRGQEIFITTSIGVALGDGGGDRPEEFLRNADTAMYRAKALGRARHELFDNAMYTQTLELLQLETDLRRAIVPQFANLAQEFFIDYQPIVEIESEQIVGVEALVRWHHPDQGIIPPKRFIPIAEDTGLIIPLGRWILSEACQQLRQWQHLLPKNAKLSLSVNLSTRQFSQPDLILQIRQIIEQCNLLSGGLSLGLKLEITESALMQNTDTATVMLEQLKELGVQLLIDDFGTGYSSLSYLQRFPIDMVKIDQSFVSQLGIDEESDEIVRAIVNLAHNLKLGVIAEGVETPEQLEQLRSLQAEFAQGYLFSQPVNSATITQLLLAQNSI